MERHVELFGTAGPAALEVQQAEQLASEVLWPLIELYVVLKSNVVMLQLHQVLRGTLEG